MWLFESKWRMRGWWFRAKKHLYCRFFHWRNICHPEVWGRGINGPWHCARCVPCGRVFDYLLERLELEKRKKGN